jgi:hypothetical protein
VERALLRQVAQENNESKTGKEKRRERALWRKLYGDRLQGDAREQ